MDALEQAIWQRKTPDNSALGHHSDRGSQYLSIKYTERLAEAEIDLSVGTVGDAYDNALTECVIGLFKTEVLLSVCKQTLTMQRINQIGPWKSMREVEGETLKWVDWYNNVRGLSRTNGVHPLTLLGPIGYITPAEAEEAFYANLNTLDMVAQSLNKSPSGKAGAVQSGGARSPGPHRACRTRARLLRPGDSRRAANLSAGN